MTEWTRRDLLKTSGLVLSSGIVSRVVGNRGAEALPVADNAVTRSNGLPPNGRDRVLLDFGWRFHFGHASDPSKDFGCDGQSRSRRWVKCSSRRSLYSTTASGRPLTAHTTGRLNWTSRTIRRLRAHGFKPIGRNYPATSIG
jgi:beta-galactosidase